MLIENFCNLLRERSTEHISSGQLLFANGHYGQVVSILRQELESLVKAVFLIDQDIPTRLYFIEQTLNNNRWTYPNTRTLVTDRHMVDKADKLWGWTASVYKLGCAFIHLSPMANYKNENPFLQLTDDEIRNVKQHLHTYHGFPLSNDLSMITVSPYLLKVLTKVAGNLECYIQDIENNKLGND